MDFPKKVEGTDHRCIVYLKKKDIFKNQKSGEKLHKLRGQPTSVAWNFANAMAKTCSVLSVKIAQIVSKTTTRKLSIGVLFLYYSWFVFYLNVLYFEPQTNICVKVWPVNIWHEN